MDLLFVVSDAFRTREGELVIAGVNPRLDPLREEMIQDLVGTRVLIVDGGMGRAYPVKRSSAPASLIGRRNILVSLCCEADTVIGDGAQVHRVL
jgi:hypothetical protein